MRDASEHVEMGGGRLWVGRSVFFERHKKSSSGTRSEPSSAEVLALGRENRLKRNGCS